MKKKMSALLAGALGITMSMAPGVYAKSNHHGHPDIDRVLLISIDGMHALDFANCAKGVAGANGGKPYCPSLAALGQTGVNYLATSTSKPSDSFPGLMAMVAGGSPRTVGAFYDVAYDRSLAPPARDTGNGLLAGACTPNVANGTTTEYEEGIDYDQTKLDGGASSHGGIAINPLRLPRDPANSCAPVQPYNFVRANTIFGVIHAAHGYTAWSDKHPAPVPELFGMNFQAVSIGQKLIYPSKHGAPPAPFSVKGGYLDSIGTPTPSLLQEIEFVDRSIGLMVAELKSKGLLDETLIVVSAKHGQSPIYSGHFLEVKQPNDPASILDAFLPASESQSGGQIGPTQDDVSLLWLRNSSDTEAAVTKLETTSPANNNTAGIGEIFSGPAIGLMYILPGLPPNGDSRTPDIIVTPNIGVVYSGSGKKLAEHGGFAPDDTNVIMLLSNPAFVSSTVTSPVETAQIAPTILTALRLDPNSLQSVQKEGTQTLPGLDIE